MKNAKHLRHATVRLEAGSKVIYVDPYLIDEEKQDADIIFVTHTHYDHFSMEDIKKIMKKDTVLVITEDGVEAAREGGITNIVSVVPGKSYNVEGIGFKTIPSYNINKKFHPKSSKWVGYIINANNLDYYIAGDTDLIPEMKDIKADVVFLPVGGTYTMTSNEAVEAANIINPDIAVPIHYTEVVGTEEDALNFIKGLNTSIKGVKRDI